MIALLLRQLQRVLSAAATPARLAVATTRPPGKHDDDGVLLNLDEFR